MEPSSRRHFLRSAGVVATVATTGASALAQNPAPPAGARGTHATHPPPGTAGRAAGAGASPDTYIFFNPEEAAFIEAAVARLIPSDETGPGAIEAGVPFFIDRQLAGAWGAGERLYRSGPWHPGTPEQGYQLPYTPAELFRAALGALRQQDSAAGATPFAKMNAAGQDEALKRWQTGTADLGGVPSNVFFESLWGLTLEGWFGDPVYGGNRGMVSWRIIGFPGAYANYYQYIDQHGIAFEGPPVSLAENGRGVIHIHPDIPATRDGVAPNPQRNPRRG